MRSDASLAARPLEEETRECNLCGAPATGELFTSYWRRRPCCDRPGSEAMRLNKG
jgi:hypothetical protein